MSKNCSFKEPVMQAIILTHFGDILRLDHTSMLSDDTQLSRGTKWHGNNCKCIDVNQVSQTHSRLVCRACGTLIIIPNEVDTYGKLRKWCKESIEIHNQLAKDDAFRTLGFY